MHPDDHGERGRRRGEREAVVIETRVEDDLGEQTEREHTEHEHEHGRLDRGDPRSATVRHDRRRDRDDDGHRQGVGSRRLLQRETIAEADDREREDERHRRRESASEQRSVLEARVRKRGRAAEGDPHRCCERHPPDAAAHVVEALTPLEDVEPRDRRVEHERPRAGGRSQRVGQVHAGPERERGEHDRQEGCSEPHDEGPPEVPIAPNPKRRERPGHDGRHRGDRDLGLGQQGRSRREPGEREPSHPAGPPVAVDRRDPTERDPDAVRDVRRVRGEEREVTDRGEVPEDREHEEHEARHDGGETSTDPAKEPVEQRQDARGQGDVEARECADARTGEAERERVHVRRERAAVVVRDLRMERVPGREAVRHVQHLTVVDHRIRPAVPRDGEPGGEDDTHEGPIERAGRGGVFHRAESSPPPVQSRIGEESSPAVKQFTARGSYGAYTRPRWRQRAPRHPYENENANPFGTTEPDPRNLARPRTHHR